MQNFKESHFPKTFQEAKLAFRKDNDAFDQPS